MLLQVAVVWCVAGAGVASSYSTMSNELSPPSADAPLSMYGDDLAQAYGSQLTNSVHASQGITQAVARGYAPYRNDLQEDDLSEPANYEFEYGVQDGNGAEFGHRERRQGGDAWGEYSVALPDGRTQRVVYRADSRGFQPLVTYD